MWHKTKIFKCAIMTACVQISLALIFYFLLFKGDVWFARIIESILFPIPFAIISTFILYFNLENSFTDNNSKEYELV